MVVDGSTALIKDYESATDQCPSLESMQITFKSPGSFKRERADSVSRTPLDSAGAAAAAGVPEGGEPDVPAGTDASPASERVRRVERSPFPGQHGSFSPSVFFQSPMPQHGVQMQMVDGFVVPSPSMSKSAQKKRSVAASKGKSSSASARKRAAVPGGYVNADNAAGGAGGSAGGRGRSASLSPPATRGRSRATTPDSPWETGASAGLSEPRGHLASAESGEKPVFTHLQCVTPFGEVRDNDWCPQTWS